MRNPLQSSALWTSLRSVAEYKAPQNGRVRAGRRTRWLSAGVGGRIIDMTIAEAIASRKATRRRWNGDVDLALLRASVGRSPMRTPLLQAGARGEDLRPAEAQAAAAAPRRRAEAEPPSGNDWRRFERLLEMNSGSQKQQTTQPLVRRRRGTALPSSRARTTAAREGSRVSRVRGVSNRIRTRPRGIGGRA